MENEVKSETSLWNIQLALKLQEELKKKVNEMKSEIATLEDKACSAEEECTALKERSILEKEALEKKVSTFHETNVLVLLGMYSCWILSRG